MTDLAALDADLQRLGPLATFNWHLQQQFALASATDVVVVLGGNQCLGGEQAIYDPVAGVSRRIDSLTGPSHVWAWDGEKLVVAEATASFPKDRGLLYRYELSNGESFVASPSHHVLCADGTYRALQDVRPGCGLFPPESTSGSDLSVPPSGGPRWTRTVPTVPGWGSGGTALATSDEVLVVTDIVHLRTDVYWDIEVPGYQNYLCAGAIHHNSGKTTVGGGMVGRVVRREGPIYRRLRNPQTRPLKIWVAPQTLEKFKSNWERKLLSEVFAGVEVDYTQSPFPVFRWHDAVTRKLSEGQPKEVADKMRNELWCKSHDQGFLSFESDVVDLVLFDEEPADRRLYTSAKQRGATVNGVVAFTFTPLLGMSWTYTEFYQPCAKDSFQVADRVWRRGSSLTLIQMGMADNPEAVAGGGVARLRDDPGMTEAEKDTRLYGKYGYTEGLIFPALGGLTKDAEDIHLLDRVPLLKKKPTDPDEQGQKMPLSWVLAADPNKRHGAVLVGIDPFGNHYVCDEHYADGLPDSLHAQAYKDILKRWDITLDEVLMGADPGGAGAQAIINLLDHDLPFQSVKKDAGSVAASIQLLRRLLYVDPTHAHPVTGKLGAPRWYFLRSLHSTWREDGVEHHESRAMYEFRQYRQKPNAPPDTPIKERDDVVDPCRYVTLLRPWTPEIDAPEEAERKAAVAKLDPLSRRVEDEFEQMVEQAARQKQRKRGTDLSR